MNRMQTKRDQSDVLVNMTGKQISKRKSLARLYTREIEEGPQNIDDIKRKFFKSDKRGLTDVLQDDCQQAQEIGKENQLY